MGMKALRHCVSHKSTKQTGSGAQDKYPFSELPDLDAADMHPYVAIARTLAFTGLVIFIDNGSNFSFSTSLSAKRTLLNEFAQTIS